MAIKWVARTVLSVLLLVFIWRSAPWPVALALCLLMVRAEAEDIGKDLNKWGETRGKK